MADLQTPSSAAMSTINAGADDTNKLAKTKPEKPNEPQFKENLAKAEKDHAIAQEKVVSWPGAFSYKPICHDSCSIYNTKMEKQSVAQLAYRSLVECHQSSNRQCAAFE